MNRREEHINELRSKLAHDMLERTTLGMAELLGYSPYDLKIAHDWLVEHGHEPLPHLSDEVYRAAMDVRKAAS